MNSLVFELVGPAGVGKTVMLHAITRLAPVLRTGLRIDRMRQFPAIAWSTVALTPAILETMFTDTRQLWSGIRHMGRLRSLAPEVARAHGVGHDAILLDEGPVFSLGRLSVFNHAGVGSGPLARQWNSEVDRWSRLLDGVIMLDAPNAVLAERIRRRSKAHEVKNGSDGEVFEFLDRYRAAYHAIVDRLMASGQLQIVHFDTSTTPIERIATEALTALNGWGFQSAVPTAHRGI